MKYSIKDFKNEFPNDEACLDYIFKNKHPDLTGAYYKIKDRKCYENVSGQQIHPLRGTIFEKSSTPLVSWFYAIYLFSASKNGVSAKELERHLGVTYKTAWRIANQIRKLMNENYIPSGTVEMDETYIGGRRPLDRKFDNKTPVVGSIERKVCVNVKVTQDTSATTLQRFMKSIVKDGSTIYTDEWKGYFRASRPGYIHHSVVHSEKQWADGNVHTNSIEGFWSQMKRSIRGTYHWVSPQYMQSYVDEFAFCYNRRDNLTPLFQDLINRV